MKAHTANFFDRVHRDPLHYFLALHVFAAAQITHTNDLSQRRAWAKRARDFWTAYQTELNPHHEWLTKHRRRYDNIQARRDGGETVASFEKEFVHKYDRRKRGDKHA